METPNEILTELQEIAPFLGRDGLSRAPYTVPAGYFGDFMEMLMDRIHFENAGISEPEPEQEISEISPLLAGLQKKNPYKLPEGYFGARKITIPEPKKTPAKIISIPFRVIRYAAAACIAIVLGTGIFKMSYHRVPADPLQGLTAVSDQDMANYLDADDIHWTPGVETASVDFSDNDIHELLSNVPDDELVQYSRSLPEDKGTVN